MIKSCSDGIHFLLSMFQVGDDVDVPLVSPADISFQVGYLIVKKILL